MPQEPLSLSVTSISQFVSFQNCERYLRFRIYPNEAKDFLDRWGLTIQPLTPLLADAGTEFEQNVEGKIAETGEEVIDLRDADEKETVRWLQEASSPVNLLQAPVSAQLGRIICRGEADIVRLHRDKGGRLHAHIADIKASRKPRMEHQLQVAAYARAIQEMAREAGAGEIELQGSVLHLQEDGSLPDFDPNNPNVDLETYFTVLERLLSDPDSLVDRVAKPPFDEVSCHLTYRCDGCLFNAVCMYDSSERQDLSLIQGLTAAEKKALNTSGVTNLRELASLMDLPERGSKERSLKVAHDQQDVNEQLSTQWSVAPKLPFLVQKARASLRTFDKTVKSARLK